MDHKEYKTERFPPLVAPAQMCLFMSDDIGKLCFLHAGGQIDLRSEQPQNKRRLHLIANPEIVPQPYRLTYLSSYPQITVYGIPKHYDHTDQP